MAPALLLLHGWPHSSTMWTTVAEALSGEFTVVAPDLPGIGASAPPSSYDAAVIGTRLDALMHDSGHDDYALVATDVSVPAAFLLALRRPDRVRGLALFEGTLPGVAGAEQFFAGGAPWWFGLHSVPGFAERVLAGHEAEYVRFFLDAGTTKPVEASVVAEIAGAYEGAALGRSLEYYRALPAGGAQIAAELAERRMIVPTLALGAQPVGDALARQLVGVTDDLTARTIDGSGHIVALDAPHQLLAHLLPFLRRTA